MPYCIRFFLFAAAFLSLAAPIFSKQAAKRAPEDRTVVQANLQKSGPPLGGEQKKTRLLGWIRILFLLNK